MTLTLQADETTASGFTEAWESSSVTRNYIVRYVSDDGTDSLTGSIELYDARALSDIPSLGDTHPILGWPCASVVAEYVDSSHHVVSVAATYRQTLATVGDVEFTRIQMQPQLQYVDTYRVGAVVPPGGNVNDGNEAVAGGVCTSGGFAVSVSIVTGVLTITYDQAGLPYWVWLTSQMGKRNSVGFIGFNPGSLVYMGPSIRRTGSVVSSFDAAIEGTYEITHTFEFNEMLHCQQYAIGNTETGIPLTDEDGCVANLIWKQPHPSLVDFWSFGIPGLGEL